MGDADESHGCALTLGQADARASDDRALAARVKGSERLGQDLRVNFAGGPHSRRLVDRFARNEGQCCGFFDFAVEECDDVIALEILAPAAESAQWLVDAAQRAFDPAVGSRDSSAGGAS